MDQHMKKLNRSMIFGWLLIVLVLFVTYTLEVYKGERTVPYLIAFLFVTVVPAIIGLFLYFNDPSRKGLCYFVVWGYFVMYTFVMMTGKSVMVSVYILPMLSLMVLYHKPSLILSTGIASLIVNLISVIYRFHTGFFKLSNSDQAEIEIGMIVLCYGGSYIATRLYDGITKQNEQYVHMLNNKNDLLNEKNEQIQKMNMQTITLVVNALDAKDSYSEGHSRRVAAYSTMIAERLGLSAEEIENIHIVALLHDIGKIGVPDSVLKKPGKLTDEEFSLMKQHTIFGSDMIKDIDMIPGIEIGTKYHHERYDGRGYPEGLKCDEIPYIARIIAVADAFDAMTSNRVYRKHLTYDQVLSELKKGEGTQFDPEIAKVMEQLILDGSVRDMSPDMIVDEISA